MARQLRFLFCLLLLLTPVIGWADGKVFTQAVALPTTTPDQRALLYFSNGVERLVIETSFVGEGTNFAWVVPLPSAPKIEAVSTNFFPSLSQAFQPKLIHEKSPAAALFLILGIVISGGIAAHRQGMSLLGYLCLVTLFVFLALLAVPGFVRARGGGSINVADTIQLLNQERVGIFDTVTLAGTDGRDLFDWLNANKFHTPKDALPVLTKYTEQKWVFVAAKIHRDELKSGRSQPHPLAFTFETEKAVYPLRLTGIENGNCTIELFVFGPSRAAANHFNVEYCGVPAKFPDLKVNSEHIGDLYKEFLRPPNPGEHRIANRELQRFALPASVTTKLVGKLNPGNMQEDAWIKWVPYEPLVPTVYSAKAARSRAFGWFVAVFISGGILIQLVAVKLKRRTIVRSLLWLVAIALICGVVRFTMYKVVPVRETRDGWWKVSQDFKRFHYALLDFSESHKTLNQLSIDELTAQLKEYGRDLDKNIFTGMPLREEASAGNIVFQEATNATILIWHDIDSNPHELTTLKTSASQP